MDIDNPSLKEAMERKEDLPGDEKKKDYHVGLPVRNLDQLIAQVSAHNVLFSCFSFGWIAREVKDLFLSLLWAEQMLSTNIKIHERFSPK